MDENLLLIATAMRLAIDPDLIDLVKTKKIKKIEVSAEELHVLRDDQNYCDYIMKLINNEDQKDE